MEFHEKLQILRKQKGLTQEEVAQILYVSRTAVSKWESGRGYPNIESLKAIANVYNVTVDELLSSSEILTIAESDNRQKQLHCRDLVFGLLDLSVILLLILPVFGHRTGETVQTFSLVFPLGIASYMRVAYLVITVAIVAWGIVTLALQTVMTPFWQRMKTGISCCLHVIGLLLLIIGSQPYAAVLLLFLLLIKAFILLKKR